MHFIHNIEVVYGDEPSQAPTDRIVELNDQSDNINDGYGGKHVWLVPKLGSHPTDAATSFDIAVQRDPDCTFKDLAKGAGGDYRYLMINKVATQSEKVTQVALFRRNQAMGDADRPAEWDGNTKDINRGRGGTYLYLLWKVAA